MSDPIDVLCAGIVVADHVCSPIDHLPEPGHIAMADHLLLTIGGCAANTAVDLSKMRIRSAVVGRVGKDAFGMVVGEMLKEAGVDVSMLERSMDSDTSQTLIINVAGQDRRFIHSFGANGEFSAKDIPLDQVRRSRILYLGGYMAMPMIRQDELVQVFKAAREAGVKTVLDLVTPGPGDYLAELEELLPVTDVFLPNDHEARMITGEQDPVGQAEQFRKMGAGSVVITMGGNGAVIVNDEVRLRAGTFTVPFVDGSGGGDAFDAGFIYGMLNDMSVEDCLRYASALGASCVRQIGTTPGVFTRTECVAFLQSQTLKIERL